mgnify:CR=1 FL=1
MTLQYIQGVLMALQYIQSVSTSLCCPSEKSNQQSIGFLSSYEDHYLYNKMYQMELSSSSFYTWMIWNSLAYTLVRL